MSKLRTNKVYIVGTLTQVKDVREGEKDGVRWIGGTAVIKSGDNDIETKFYSSEKTKAGKSNVKYSIYTKLADRVNERVKINGDVLGRIWFSPREGQLITFNEINAGFFNTPRVDEEDAATFEYGGFVYKPIQERQNKDGELIGYEIQIAQANFNNNNMQVVKFFVDKDRTDIVSAIESQYPKNTTVEIMGNIMYEVTNEVRTEEVSFGSPIQKIIPVTRKALVINGGKEAILDEAIAYSQEDISELETSYRNFMEATEQAAKNRADSGDMSPNNTTPAKSDNINRFM